jgi:hypothetical protein
VADDPPAQGYSQRAELIADMCGLLKAARRPLTDEWKRFDLDADGWRRLERLTDWLVRHISFEHLERDQIRRGLRDAVRRYRNSPSGRRPAKKEFAAETLDALAREPIRRTLYLGVQHLKLPHGTVVGDVRFIRLPEDEALAESFAWFRDSAPEMVCEVEAIGGTDELVLERARRTAERALALVRQQILFGFMSKIYLDQVMFGLDGKYTWREGSDVARAGWWRDPAPIPMDLTAPRSEDWLTKLDGFSADYLAAAQELRERVDMCVDWLDVAAQSDRWPIIIPAVFSGMEAILVPETSGLKAGVVTVRSLAVQLAVRKRFSDPAKVMAGYELRSDLVHGTPTPDVLDKEATDFAESTRRWAFDVFRDYLALAKDIGAGTVPEIAGYLDSGACSDVCSSLEEYGWPAIVTEYRASLNPKGSGVDQQSPVATERCQARSG